MMSRPTVQDEWVVSTRSSAAPEATIRSHAPYLLLAVWALDFEGVIVTASWSPPGHPA